MDLKDIEKIMKLMDTHELTHVKLQLDETKLELKKGGDLDMEAVSRLMASSAVAPAPVAPAPAVAAGPAPAAAEAGGLPAGVTEIKSPLVGTFYAASDPESPPFVSVGDKVTPDSTVCMIEAMKVFNKVEAEISGEIVEVLVENGNAVQFGDPLFRVKAS